MWRGLLVKNFEEAEIVTFGIAIDKNCSIRKGACKAPKILRRCSEFLPPVTMDGQILHSNLYDLGDVKKYDYEDVYQKLKLCVNKKFTLILGGDHSISILSQKAYRELTNKKVGIIHIDAHADICDYYDNSNYSHACVNRRALENGYSLSDITMIGIRSYEIQEVKFLEKNKINVYSSEKVTELGIEKILKETCEKYKDYEEIYLSFDIDAVDPSFAPGTGTPEAFGVSSKEVLELIVGLITKLPIKIMDIVEVSPPLDCNNMTSCLELKYILEIFEVVNQKK